MSVVGRPFIVTLIGVITIIFGIFEVINGLITMFSGNGFWGGLWAIIVGLIYILLARGLMGGSGIVRLLVAIITILNIIAGVWEIVYFWGGDSSWVTRIAGGFIQALVALLILILLYTPKATLFFRTHGRA